MVSIMGKCRGIINSSDASSFVGIQFSDAGILATEYWFGLELEGMPVSDTISEQFWYISLLRNLKTALAI